MQSRSQSVRLRPLLSSARSTSYLETAYRLHPIRVATVRGSQGQARRQKSLDHGSSPREYVSAFRPPQGMWEYYTYRPLTRGISAIRLVELLPGTDGQIYCKIHEEDLDSLPRSLLPPCRHAEYKALSYTWDSRTYRKFIRCDGTVLPVTQNLYDALVRIRCSDQSVLLWIDAICIDQTNTLERNRQVGLMRWIFSGASEVIAWLGEEEEGTSGAFSLIEVITAATTNLDLEDIRDTFWTHYSFEIMGLPQLVSPEWYGLFKLFGRPYFRRIWVVQELVVCKKATVRCGSLTVLWDDLQHVTRLLLAAGWRGPFIKEAPQPRMLPRAPTFAKTISNIRLGFPISQGECGMSLSLLLCVTRRFLASDPRDKVFALIGLASKIKSQSINPDYARPTVDVYRDITGYLITTEQSLTLLSTIEDISHRKPDSSLPSWVPDYSYHENIFTFGFPIGRIQYSAAGSTPVSVRWSPTSSVLAIDGFTYDEVETVSPISFTDTRNQRQVILDWLRIASSLLHGGSVDGDAFWRTLIGDSDRDTFPAPASYGAYFAHYLSHLGIQKTYGDLAGLTSIEDHPDAAVMASTYQASFEFMAWRRTFFTTRKGLIGLGPRSTQPGDKICIFSGGRVPFILRGRGTHYQLLGEAYVHGLMKGQAIQAHHDFEEFLIR